MRFVSNQQIYLSEDHMNPLIEKDIFTDVEPCYAKTEHIVNKLLVVLLMAAKIVSFGFVQTIVFNNDDERKVPLEEIVCNQTRFKDGIQKTEQQIRHVLQAFHSEIMYRKIVGVTMHQSFAFLNVAV